jgi:hypothetical protein
MASDNKNNDFEKPNVDEEYLMNVISGDEPVAPPSNNKKQDVPKETSPGKKPVTVHQRKRTTRKHFWSIGFHRGVTARSFTYALNTTKDCSASFN